MLIRTPQPSGRVYPQITDAPINYADFLNFFRGGHTIDDNLDASRIADTMQAGMLRAAIASGHLTKAKNMSNPSDSLADITLTESGAELIQSVLDREFCAMAVGLARKSIAENDGEPHPYVGAVVVKNGKVLVTGYRGETGEGRHAEYCALRKIDDNVDNVDLRGCTVYTTLEPCSERKPSKKACADRLIKGKVARVVYGVADKDESVYGHVSLAEAGIDLDLFPKDLIQELLTLNKEWSDTRRKPEVMPPPNRIGYLADAQYYMPGTSITDKIHLIVRPPKDAGGFFTVEDNANIVVAYARTLEEIAVKWHAIDTQKRLVEKMQRVSSGSTDKRLGLVG
jgi:pyrimidine deaminase RibD-like protein